MDDEDDDVVEIEVEERVYLAARAYCEMHDLPTGEGAEDMSEHEQAFIAGYVFLLMEDSPDDRH